MERATAKALGEWWGCTFRRTPSSGAWGKQGQSRFSKNKSEDAAGDFHGDIVAPKEAGFPFSVECKAYKEVELYKMLYAKSEVFEWWKQCVRDTPKGMYPMLVMKENRKNSLVVLSRRCANMLNLSDHIHKRMVFCVGSKAIVIMDLKTFLDSVTAKFVKRALADE